MPTARKICGNRAASIEDSIRECAALNPQSGGAGWKLVRISHPALGDGAECAPLADRCSRVWWQVGANLIWSDRLAEPNGNDQFDLWAALGEARPVDPKRAWSLCESKPGFETPGFTSLAKGNLALDWRAPKVMEVLAATRDPLARSQRVFEPTSYFDDYLWAANQSAETDADWYRRSVYAVPVDSDRLRVVAVRYYDVESSVRCVARMTGVPPIQDKPFPIAASLDLSFASKNVWVADSEIHRYAPKEATFNLKVDPSHPQVSESNFFSFISGFFLVSNLYHYSYFDPARQQLRLRYQTDGSPDWRDSMELFEFKSDHAGRYGLAGMGGMGHANYYFQWSEDFAFLHGLYWFVHEEEPVEALGVLPRKGAEPPPVTPEEAARTHISKVFDPLEVGLASTEFVDPIAACQSAAGPGTDCHVFKMGSPGDERGRGEDEPQHGVRLTKRFEIQKTPVTMLQWLMVMNGARAARGFMPRDGTDSEGCDDARIATYRLKNPDGSIEQVSVCRDHPLHWVKFADIAGPGGFLERLNASQDRYIYRLPTEAEWEFAARGGKKRADGSYTTYSFGDDPQDAGSYSHFGEGSDNGYAVARRLPNGYGLFDLACNVSEFVADIYDDAYGLNADQLASKDPVVDPWVLKRGGHVRRGDRRADRSPIMVIERLSCVPLGVVTSAMTSGPIAWASGSSV